SFFTNSVGKVKGLEIAKSITSKPISFALDIIHKSFSLKFSVHIKLSTPNFILSSLHNVSINIIFYLDGCRYFWIIICKILQNDKWFVKTLILDNNPFFGCCFGYEKFITRWLVVS